MNGKRRKVRYLRRRADLVLLEVMDWFESRRGIYSAAHFDTAPQNRLIPAGIERTSLEWLCMLFFFTSIMYREESEQTFRQGMRVYERCPEAFTPRMPSEQELATILREAGFGHYVNFARNWWWSGQTLFSDIYSGDPRNLFGNVRSVSGFLKYKAELRRSHPGRREMLPGFGPKIYSLLNHYYYELGQVELLPDAFPVDRHIIRQFKAWGLIEGRGQIDAATDIAEVLRCEISSFCRRHEVNPLHVSHALWLLGVHLCSNCSRIIGINLLCPVERECAGLPIFSKQYNKTGKVDFDEVERQPKGETALPFGDETTVRALAEGAVLRNGRMRIRESKERRQNKNKARSFSQFSLLFVSEDD